MLGLDRMFLSYGQQQYSDMHSNNARVVLRGSVGAKKALPIALYHYYQPELLTSGRLGPWSPVVDSILMLPLKFQQYEVH